MKVRRFTFVLVFGLFALVGGTAKAADPCADGLMPFQKADLFFSNAERADANAAKQLWTLGTQLLQAHRDDPAPDGCDIARFALAKVAVLEHGLSVGYTFAGLSADDAQKRANQLLDAAAYEARAKGSLGDVYMAWRQNERSLYDRTLTYLARLQGNANAAMIARHNPSGPGCAQPNVDVEVPNPVTPGFPEEAKDIQMHDVTVLAKVAVDATGKIESVWILQSSGNMYIDRNTILAARQTTFLPKIVDCKPVPGTYVFKATFDPLH